MIGLSLTWGSSFILIKKALIAFDEVQVASLRIAISTIVSIPIVIYYFKQIPWKKWHLFLFVGLIGNGIPPFLFSAAQTEVSSSLAGVLNTLTPIFTLLLAILFFSQKLNYKKIIGVVLGLFGTLLIAFSGDSDFNGRIFYIALIILATILYALNINAVKLFFKDTKPVLIVAVPFILFGPFSIFFLLKTSFFDSLYNHPFAINSFFAVAVLAIIGTVIATSLFFKLLQRTNTVFVSSVSYIIPLVAVSWGLLDGEPFSIAYLYSLILILIGVRLTRNNSSGISPVIGFIAILANFFNQEPFTITDFICIVIIFYSIYISRKKKKNKGEFNPE